MSAHGYSLRANLLQNLTQIKRPDVPLRVVLRNVAAVILPLGIGMASGHTSVGLGVAAGALNTMFSDQPGPYRQRVWRLLLASLAAALAAWLGFTIGDRLLPMLLTTAAFGFIGGMLVVFGSDAARVGMTSMILLVVTAATPVRSGVAALDAAALIFAGGLLMMLFSIAAWPLQRYRPERQVLATVYRGLAALARDPGAEVDAMPALTDTMTSLQHTLLGRHHARGRAMEAFGVLLELAERIRLELIAVTELDLHPALHASYRVAAAQTLDAIGEALDDGEAPRAAERALQGLYRVDGGDAQDTTGQVDALAPHLHALTGQLAAAVRNANWAGSRGELRAAAAETPLPAVLRVGSPRAILLANLTPSSVAFRHAVRSAVCLSVALFLSRQWQLPHGYWLPMTAAIVLRPDFGATLSFGLLRVIGTVLGLVLTTVLLFVTPAEPWAHLALMAVLCMAFRYLATAHYGVAVAALTGTVVVLLSFSGVDSGAAVVDRVLNTALGCGMALLAYLLWPTWERARARVAMSTMIEAYANYLLALAQPGQHDSRREARTAARTTRSNALASLERMRTEPATPPALLELAEALFTNGNRLARTAMTLEALVEDHQALPEQAEIQVFVGHVGATLHATAAALREQPSSEPLPDLRRLQRTLGSLLSMAENRALAEQLVTISDRLVDNANTLAHVVARAQPDRIASGRLRRVHP